MEIKKRNILSSTALSAAILSVFVRVGCGYSVDDKMKLEQWYASQATSVVENIIGKGAVVSFVHVYLDTVQSQKAKDVYSIDGGKQTTTNSAVVWQEDKKNQQYMLPGFPVNEGSGAPGKCRANMNTHPNRVLSCPRPL